MACGSGVRTEPALPGVAPAAERLPSELGSGVDSNDGVPAPCCDCCECDCGGCCDGVDKIGETGKCCPDGEVNVDTGVAGADEPAEPPAAAAAEAEDVRCGVLSTESFALPLVPLPLTCAALELCSESSACTPFVEAVDAYERSAASSESAAGPLALAGEANARESGSGPE